jgi:hypothetical protein
VYDGRQRDRDRRRHRHRSDEQQRQWRGNQRRRGHRRHQHVQGVISSSTWESFGINIGSCKLGNADEYRQSELFLSGMVPHASSKTISLPKYLVAAQTAV